MNKLLLTSTGFTNPKLAQEFLKLVDKPVSDIKVIFIPTAARNKEELFYADGCKRELLELGIKPESILDYNLDRKLTDEEMAGVNVIYITGGNTFYLMQKLRESGFGDVIKGLVSKGIIFLGVSAGSVVAGPDISIAGPFDPNDVGMTDFSGLDLTEIVTSPHYKDAEKSIVDEFSNKLPYRILPLTDSQALLQIDKNISIIE